MIGALLLAAAGGAAAVLLLNTALERWRASRPLPPATARAVRRDRAAARLELPPHRRRAVIPVVRIP